jgi:hypothetical protein
MTNTLTRKNMIAGARMEETTSLRRAWLSAGFEDDNL